MKLNALPVLFSIVIITSVNLFSQIPSGPEILRRVDKNLVLDKAVLTTTMIIHGRAGTRSIQSRNWIQGKEKAFVEYLEPAHERGKKMLKLGDQLWDYTPEPTDRTIMISGHLLRQSLMGSDLSYEDMTENSKLIDHYDAKVTGSEKINNRECLILELTAKVEDISYYSRKVWVDKERWVPLKEERYSKSGKPLKRVEMKEVMNIGGRWYPKRILYKDLLQTGDGTEYLIESINLNVNIPASQFTKAALKK